MWIFGRDGSFMSIVQDRDAPDRLLVRFRNRDDGEAFRALCQAHGVAAPELKRIDLADYRFRVIMPRIDVGVMLSLMIGGIDYSNYKGHIVDPERHDALLGIWDYTRRNWK